jgi:hypothetical protein
VYGTTDLEIGRGYFNQVEMLCGDRSTRRQLLRAGEWPVPMREIVMSQQSVRQAARRSALDDVQALRPKERADRERRLEGRQSRC